MSQSELKTIVLEQLKSLAEDSNQRHEATRRDLETDKIFQAILAEVSVNDRAVPSDEFHTILDEVTKKAEMEQDEDALLRASVED